jgi:molybdopterin molybdotransferase
MTELGPSPLSAGDAQLSVAQARAAIHAAIAPVQETEVVPLIQALGRVLAADVISPIDVPAHDNSAMDGFAFDGALLAAGQALTLPVLATVFAGQPYAGVVAAGSCVRIMTGAVMPAGTDTVVPHELCRVEGEQVHVPTGVIQPRENLRRRGEDLAKGGAALQRGRRLRPADVGLVASLGLAEVSVYRRLRVALFSTGDELRTLGQELPEGCVYDSNRYSLMAALQRLGVEVFDLGLVHDDPAALEATLKAGVAQADVVLTSGGVSMGDADYTREVLAHMGQVAFWKVAMRPGRPFAFGPLHHAGRSAWLFALPGNPVAALVTYYAFAREALLAMAGARGEQLVTLKVPTATAIRKRPGRTEFQRGIVSRSADGAWQVQSTGAQGAGILRSLSEANALVVLAHEQGSVAAGEMVEVWVFDGLL